MNNDNKRIAKNTILLYVRMLAMIIISFFTVRITLNALGVVDYGINNVVGGLVSMFYFISNTLSGSISRFMTFNLGKGDMPEMKKIFATSVNIHLLIAIIVIIAIETIGVWFLNNKMDIPADRLDAANWVLQCSAIIFAINVLSIPYNAELIAHEKMSVYAYMTIFDASAKLIIAYAIFFYGGDRLKILSIVSIIPVIITQLIYYTYCKKKFEECTYTFIWDKELTKKITSFAGYNFLGSTAATMKDQGVNIAINMFYGAAVNSARGVAMQVNLVITRFISNFTIALNPQITKNYAAGNLERMHSLIFMGSRLSYYIFMLLAIPVFIEIDCLLHWWLGQVPEHTVSFTRLVLILTLCETTSHTLITGQNATGNIRNYQLVVGGILLLNLPVSYLLLRIGRAPETTLVVAIVISQICLAARLLFLRKSIKLDCLRFIKQVYLKTIFVTAISALPPLAIYYSLPMGYTRMVLVVTTSLISSAITIYYIGCNSQERNKIKIIALNIKKKIIK